jgi:hypothetical protein
VDDANPLCVKKNSLGQCRFAGIDVCADSDVAYPLEIRDHYFPSQSESGALPLHCRIKAVTAV